MILDRVVIRLSVQGVKVTVCLLGCLMLASCSRDNFPRLNAAGDYQAPPKPLFPAAKPSNRPSPKAVAQWQLTPTRNGYSLDVILNGRRHFVEHGGEYMSGKRIDVTSPGVPVGAISAFDISQPDGEGMLYYISPEGGNSYGVFSRFVDPLRGGKHQAAQRVKTLTL
ncbi:hypothetical protein N9230_04215 [Akkermansiaceae bacterium]|nr:hypothetical protein [Akkermansiaceae bacterium]